jgi:hypothetical protein
VLNPILTRTSTNKAVLSIAAAMVYYRVVLFAWANRQAFNQLNWYFKSWDILILLNIEIQSFCQKSDLRIIKSEK